MNIKKGNVTKGKGWIEIDKRGKGSTYRMSSKGYGWEEKEKK